MLQLELIWELENHNNILEEYKNKVNLIKNDKEFNSMQLKHKKSVNQISDLNIKFSDIKLKLEENDLNLKNYNLRLQEIEKDLYSGEITDLVQLEYLSKEKARIAKHVEKLEDDIIELIGTSEELIIDIKDDEKIYKSLNKEIKDIKKNTTIILNDLISKIETEEKIIEEYAEKIEPKLLTRYNVLRKNRKKGIVSVVNYVCSGCNMMVPSFLGEALKGKSEIIYCESCGRILYYQNNDI